MADTLEIDQHEFKAEGDAEDNSRMDADLSEFRLPNQLFSRREREVLKDPVIREKYTRLKSEGKLEQAKHFLSYEVSILRIHEANSRLAAIPDLSEEKLTTEPLLSKPHPDSLNQTSEDESEEKLNENISKSDEAKSPIEIDEVDSRRRRKISVERMPMIKHISQRPSVLGILRSDHCEVATKFFFYNVFLVIFDIFTDLNVVLYLFGRNQHDWAAFSFICIFSPFFGRFLCQQVRIAYFNHERFVSSRKAIFSAVGNSLWQLPVLLPIRNLRLFFGLILMDSGLPDNSHIVSQINRKGFESGLFEAFLQSAPQFILQSSIVLRTGIFSPAQGICIFSSFLMLIFTSARLYFHQRLSTFQNFDPSTKSLFFVLPYIAIINLSLLLILSIFAAFARGYVIICILIIIAINYTSVKTIVFKCKPLPTDKSLYMETKKSPTYSHLKAKAREETLIVFWTGILTSWISPCTVWINSLKQKSNFLIVSGVTNFISYCVIVCAIYLVVLIEETPDLMNATILHCFKNLSETDNVIILHGPKSILQRVNKTDLLPRIRNCSDGEESAQLFTNRIGPCLFMLLFLVVLASIVLQFLGNHVTMFKMSKLVFAELPLIDVSLLHDYLRNFYTLDTDQRNNVGEIFSFSLHYNKKLLYKQDRFGKTAPHVALEHDMYEQLYQMLCAGGDFYIQDQNGNSVAELLKRRKQSPVSSEDELKSVEKILAKLNKENSVAPFISLWSEPPMHKAMRKDRIYRLMLLQLLGGEIGSIDQRGSSIFKSLLSMAATDELNSYTNNSMMRLWLANVRDEKGQTLLHLACRRDESDLIDRLVKVHNVEVNCRVTGEGSTPLHLAVISESIDSVGKLIANKAKINAKNVMGFTPLHDAAGLGRRECASLLLQHEAADVDAKNSFGVTPLHLAALWGKSECVRLLLENNANVDARDSANNTPLHMASWIVPHFEIGIEKQKCVEMMIARGADKNAKNNRGKVPEEYQIL